MQERVSSDLLSSDNPVGLGVIARRAAKVSDVKQSFRGQSPENINKTVIT